MEIIAKQQHPKGLLKGLKQEEYFTIEINTEAIKLVQRIDLKN